MASAKEMGLFVPPEKERELQELGEVEQEQRSRTSRRLWFRWVGWGALMLLLAQWTGGFLFFFVPKRLGSFGGVVTAGNVSTFKVGDVQVVRDGKFYITRVPEGFLA